MTERQIILPPEEERAAIVHHSVQAAGDLHEMLSSTADDIDRWFKLSDGNTVGRSFSSLISEGTKEIAQASGWHGDDPAVFVNAILVNDGEKYIVREEDTSLGLNTDLLLRFNSRDDIELEVKEAITRNPDAFDLYWYLFTINPIVASTTAVLQNSALHQSPLEPGSRYPVAFEEWYLDMFGNVNASFKNALTFFAAIRSNVPEKDELTQDFLRNWQKESLLPLAEILNIANCMALHVQTNDCGVLMTKLPTHGNTSERLRVSQDVQDLWLPDVLSDGRKSVYSQYQSKLREDNAKNPADPLIPIFLHVTDVNDYAVFLNRFWQQVSDGMVSRKGARIDRQYDGMDVLRLGNAAEVLFRPEATDKGQARIALQGTGNLAGFIYRIDKDRYGKIGTDFGGVTNEEMIAYAREVRAKDENYPTLIQYSPVVDDNGRLKVQARGIPTVMRSTASFVRSNGTIQRLTNGNKAAIVAAVAMQEGQGVGLRFNDSFTYHSYEYLQDPRFAANFSKIAESVKKGFLK